MNRRQKIIVSVIGIFIVLIALIGITYGYFLTRIQGNTNITSITVTTADLKLVYGDGNNIITGTNIEPGWITNGLNGNPSSKTFTVTNEGNKDVTYSVYLENVVNSFSRLGDITYTLTCSNLDNTSCGIYESVQFPEIKSKLATATIGTNENNRIQTWELAIEYAYLNIDQSEDMGQFLEARIQIANDDVRNRYTGWNIVEINPDNYSNDYSQIEGEKVVFIFAPGNYTNIESTKMFVSNTANNIAVVTDGEVNIDGNFYIGSSLDNLLKDDTSTILVDGLKVKGQIVVNSVYNNVTIINNKAANIEVRLNKKENPIILAQNNHLNSTYLNDESGLGSYGVQHGINVQAGIKGHTLNFDHNVFKNIRKTPIAFYSISGVTNPEVKDVNITNNYFISWGSAKNTEDYGAIKVWNDINLAPINLETNLDEEITDAAYALIDETMSDLNNNMFGKVPAALTDAGYGNYKPAFNIYGRAAGIIEY